MEQRPPFDMAHIAAWPEACSWPSHGQTFGGHAHASTAASAGSYRASGARKETRISPATARRMDLGCCSMP